MTAPRAPVVFMVFNRPTETAQVFRAIERARPEHLLIIADGPRPGLQTDVALCAEVRRIVSDVTWPCKVHANMANTNMGCGRRVSSGLDWAFSIVERAIILEDDCLPCSSFFPFCEAMLDRYESDHRVFMVTGHNNLGKYRSRTRYVFSRHSAIWGWATWARAWRHFDYSMSDWPKHREPGALDRLMPYREVCATYRAIFDATCGGKIDTWDYQWTYAVLKHGGLCVTPARNMVTNIGAQGVHTLGRSHVHFQTRWDIELRDMVHPRTVGTDERFDRAIYRKLYPAPSASERLRIQGLEAYEAGRFSHAMVCCLLAIARDPRELANSGTVRLLGSIVKRGLRKRLTGRAF